MRAPSVLLLPGSPRPHRRSTRTRRLAAVALVLGLVGGVTFSAAGASAQTVERLQARADRLANELEQLEVRASQLDEQYLELTEEIAAVREERGEVAEAVSEARERLAEAEGQATDYLIEAYIGAGSHERIVLGNSDPNQAVNTQVLLELLRGDSQLLADEIAASRAELEDRSAELTATDERLAEREAAERQVVDEIEATIAEHTGLLDSANSELREAIEAERARREAEAAERARREAEARAAEQARQAEAEAARVAATTTTAAPSTTTGGTSSTAAPAPTPAPTSAPQRAAAPAPAPAPPSTAPLPASPPRSGAAGAIAAARTQLGLPYRWGGTSPATGFDCSGLMQWAWAQAGVSLPRTSGAQRAATQRISVHQLQPGDLVFAGSPVHHVGMYVGGGQMIHSPRTGDVVKISSIHRGFGSMSYGRIG